MKNDQLEQYIIKNRKEFDMFDPDINVWDRISNTQQKKKPRPFFGRPMFLKVASVAAIIIITFSIQELRYNPGSLLSGNKTDNFDENQIPELMEAKVYYTGMLNEKMNEIELMSTDSPEIIEDLNEDMGDLDNAYNSLKADLKDNISNREIIEAMIHNYRLKLQILEDFLRHLKKSDDENINERGKGYVKI